MAGRGFMAARRRVGRAKAGKRMGAAGRNLRRDIISQHAKKISGMKRELRRIKDPVQKKFLAGQIRIEAEELKWFVKGTKK